MDEEFQLRLGKKKLEDNERTAKKRAKRCTDVFRVLLLQ